MVIFPAYTLMQAPQIDWERIRTLGRRLALQVGVEPGDGAQEACLIAWEVATESRELPKANLLIRRVHDRLLGRKCGHRMDRNQALSWCPPFVCVEAAVIENMAGAADA
jgi:hypothetical protein